MRKIILLITLFFLHVGAFNGGYTSPDTNSHQGYTTDGVNHYTIDTVAFYKKNQYTWATTATNSNPFVGQTGYDHLGDADYYNGKIYIGCNYYNSCQDTGKFSLCVYNASDLSQVSVTELDTNGGANEHSTASVVVVPEHGDNGIIYFVAFCDGTKIWKHDLSDFSYVGSITLGTEITGPQGIAWKNGKFYISGNSDRVYQVDEDGSNVTSVITLPSSQVQGIDYSTNQLRVMVDSGTPEKVYYYTNDGDGQMRLDGVSLSGVTLS